MCRFLLYMGPPVLLNQLIIEPENSLINQSIHSKEREEPLNGDGFGVTWYVPSLSHHPGAMRSISPAWSNRNLQHTSQVTQSACVLAHVRAASDAMSVSETNCHPFVHGPFSFMHNGDVAQFQRHRRQFLAELSDTAYNMIEGTTDSEVLFGLFLDRWHDGGHITDPAARIATALRQCIAYVAQHTPNDPELPDSYLNIAVSDGVHAAVSRYTTSVSYPAESLHFHRGKTYSCRQGQSYLSNPTTGQGAIIVSSEALNNDPGWQVVPNNTLLILQPGGVLSMQSLEDIVASPITP